MGEKAPLFNFLGLTFNLTNIISITVVMLITFFLILWLSRRPQIRPSGRQNVLEWIIDFTNKIVESSLPNRTGQNMRVLAFVLFIFIFIANQLGLIFQVKIGEFTFLKSPTADPIVTMTLAMIMIVMAHYLGVATLGFKKYFKNNYLSPYVFLFPVNLIEEFTSFLTLGLRLFGNIMAGEMLLNLIASFAFSHGVLTFIPGIILEVIWQGFSVFIGSVQAYVFVTLAMVYISEKTIVEEL
ncbi:F0F1 ATP synthase subunit A [Periweissella ghanensis]|uniref:ATP synthase subunit a n=1 Tax=Periweissella ghanensis TaxID=467997 RepID=A0ABN8BPU1_9LACO|nr:F0F1 ATP synthase subunit A [Periweissella ghanensis]MCM0601570.1 F0F1 ATP synthase subunit A [Periweissella ghanensis]CAH0418647.1 ATP synthase subunit a [Periweissella ghanensis]